MTNQNLYVQKSYIMKCKQIKINNYQLYKSKKHYLYLKRKLFKLEMQILFRTKFHIVVQK